MPTPELKKESYLYPLTGIRGIAALMVVFSHFKDYDFPVWFNYPRVGEFSVMLFFALSGFLMGYLYSVKRFDSDQVFRYAVSRFSRIAPAYLVVVISFYLIFQFLDADFPIQITTENLLRHLMFSGNQNILWSIPPEVQFYGFFVFFWGAVFMLRERQQLLPLLLLLAACVFFTSYRDSVPGTFVGSKITYFMVGAVAGALRPYLDQFSLRDNTLSALQGLLLVGAFTVLLWPNPVDNGFALYWSDISNAGWAGLAILVFSFSSTVTRWTMKNQPMQKLGLWSFSLYLTHVPVLFYTNVVLGNSGWWTGATGVLLSLVVACGFYQWIEKPGISVTRRLLSQVSIRSLPFKPSTIKS